MASLTRKQQQIYDYILSFTNEHGYPPSVREIGAAVGLKSPSTVHFHMKGLEEAGASPLPAAGSEEAGALLPEEGSEEAGALLLPEEGWEDELLSSCFCFSSSRFIRSLTVVLPLLLPPLLLCTGWIVGVV